MQSFTPENVINGTFGEAWFDGEYMAEVTRLRMDVTVSYTDVRQARKLMAGKKMTGIAGEGEVTMSKVSSTVAKKYSDALKQGKTPSMTIMSKLDDPAALGAERVVAYGCKLEKVTLADWENGSLGSESYAFSFEDWDFLDAIE